MIYPTSRVYWLLAVCCLCLWARVGRAQGDDRPTERSLPPTPPAHMAITLYPRGGGANANLNAVSPNAVTKAEVSAAFAQALGAGSERRLYFSSLPYAESLRYEDEDAPPQPARKPKPGDPFLWDAQTPSLAGVKRAGLWQSGRFDPAPINRILAKAGVRRLRVEIFLGGVPYTECVGAAPVAPSPFARSARPAQSPQLFRAEFDTAQPGTPITFGGGYRIADVLRDTGLPLAVLLLAPFALLFYRARALRAFDRADALESDDPGAAERIRENVRFGLLKLVTSGGLVLSLVWGGLNLLFHPVQPLLFALNLSGNEARLGIIVLSVTVPSFLALLLCLALALPVLNRAKVGGAEAMTAGDLLLKSGGQFALSLLPLLFVALAVGALLDSHFLMLLPFLLRSGGRYFWAYAGNASVPRLFGWLALALVARPLVAQWSGVATGLSPVLLKAGALFDRVHELARKAGVAVKEVVFLPTGKEQMANAFAARGNLVLFTDRLLAELTRPEVDGVIAHELAHLKRKHGEKLGSAGFWLVAVPLGAVLFLDVRHLLPGDSRWWFLGAVLAESLLALLITRAMSRRFEREADLDAVALTGDPGGLIRGLARLRRLSGLPDDWGNTEAQFLTHPSTARRTQYLSPSGVPQAAGDENAEPDTSHYPPPPEADAEHVFSSAATTRRAVAMMTVTLLLFAAVPCVFAHLAEWWGVTLPVHLGGWMGVGGDRLAMARAVLGKPNWALLLPTYAAGAAATLGAYLLRQNYTTMSFYREREPMLRKRLIENGKLSPSDAASAVFVALTPGTAPRYFGGAAAWDMGYLVFERDRVRYVGEKITFAVAAGQITAIRQSPLQLPGWISAPRAELRWVDGEAGAGILLAPAGFARLTDAPGATAALLVRLRAWHEAAAPAPAEPIPVFPSANAFAPRDLVKPKMVLALLVRHAAVAFAAAALTGLPLRGIAACVLTVTAIIGVELARFAAYREPPLSPP